MAICTADDPIRWKHIHDLAARLDAMWSPDINTGDWLISKDQFSQSEISVVDILYRREYDNDLNVTGEGIYNTDGTVRTFTDTEEYHRTLPNLYFLGVEKDGSTANDPCHCCTTFQVSSILFGGLARFNSVAGVSDCLTTMAVSDLFNQPAIDAYRKHYVVFEGNTTTRTHPICEKDGVPSTKNFVYHLEWDSEGGFYRLTHVDVELRGMFAWTIRKADFSTLYGRISTMVDTSWGPTSGSSFWEAGTSVPVEVGCDVGLPDLLWTLREKDMVASASAPGCIELETLARVKRPWDHETCGDDHTPEESCGVPIRCNTINHLDDIISKMESSLTWECQVCDNLSIDFIDYNCCEDDNLDLYINDEFITTLDFEVNGCCGSDSNGPCPMTRHSVSLSAADFTYNDTAGTVPNCTIKIELKVAQENCCGLGLAVELRQGGAPRLRDTDMVGGQIGNTVYLRIRDYRDWCCGDDLDELDDCGGEPQTSTPPSTPPETSTPPATSTPPETSTPPATSTPPESTPPESSSGPTSESATSEPPPADGVCSLVSCELKEGCSTLEGFAEFDVDGVTSCPPKFYKKKVWTDNYTQDKRHITNSWDSVSDNGTVEEIDITHETTKTEIYGESCEMSFSHREIRKTKSGTCAELKTDSNWTVTTDIDDSGLCDCLATTSCPYESGMFGPHPDCSIYSDDPCGGTIPDYAEHCNDCRNASERPSPISSCNDCSVIRTHTLRQSEVLDVSTTSCGPFGCSICEHGIYEEFIKIELSEEVEPELPSEECDKDTNGDYIGDPDNCYQISSGCTAYYHRGDDCSDDCSENFCMGEVTFTLELTGLTPGCRYQVSYEVTYSPRCPGEDPFTELVTIPAFCASSETEQVMGVLSPNSESSDAPTIPINYSASVTDCWVEGVDCDC